ncbi:MAG: 2-C-methyl-D-erythritol 4-phosphate cytidylyltransferase, partial [Chlamydiae bacterium]|nr:2-C-methyl-D-erythritol 4-phosphate cytidylyltransferase [Chlamydiota bacterium]
MNTKCSAIILMAGKGERFGSTLPKQFHRLSGKPVFIHTVETMLVSNLFHEIILVYPKNWLAKIKLELSTITTSIPIHFVQGGDTRKNSSYLGIQAVDKKTTHVLIHDAVRPFVSQRILVENVSYAIQHGAVDTCIPSADTVVNIDEQLYISQIPNRNLCMRGQTPQTFSLPLIKEAHEVFFKDENLPVTDDCSLITLLGKKVKVVQGEEKNIKITTELDLFLAEQLLRIPDLSYPSSSPNFQDKTFVITGGTGAIGTHVQKKLIQHGAKVISISRNSKNYQADLSDSRQAKK